MTNNLRIDVVHRFGAETPSVKNLLQGLKNTNDLWEIHSHSLRPPLNNRSKYMKAMLENVSTIHASRLASKIRPENDILIIHKALHKDLLHRLFDRNVAENIFLRFNNVVYSTYDAEFLTQPDKSRLLFQKSDLVYATSKYIQNEAEQYAPPDSISYIPPSVDTEFFSPDYNIPEKYKSDRLILGWLGNASVHENDLKLLLERLQGIGDKLNYELRLLLGGSALPQSIRPGLANLQADVQTIEYLPWSEVPVFINSLDIGLAPLTNAEFNKGRSSEKIREYMSCGLPTIASNIGENPYLLEDQTGIIANSPEEWKNAIIHFSDPDQRKIYGKNARERCVKRFSTEVIGKKIKQEFKSNLSI